MKSKSAINEYHKRLQDLKTYAYLMFDHACNTKYMYNDLERQIYALRGALHMGGSMSGWENYLRKMN